MLEYTLYLNPETHVRSTQDDATGFRIFGHLHRIAQRTAIEEESYRRRIEAYPGIYKRFLQLDRYNDYKRRLVDEAARQGFYLRDAGMKITFYIPVPPSWRPGKKAKKHMTRHQSKPDIDNFEKALFDSLRPHQDHAIWQTNGMKKLWVNEPAGCIRIEVEEQPEESTEDPHQLKLRFRK